jgi:phosphatidyl-myo-inositol dimannoside synthase
MPKVLIITNDFPPRVGGIQAFVHSLALQLPEQVVVYAPAWRGALSFDGALPFPVVRHPTSLMLPIPQVRQRAIAIMKSHGCDTVLFGAAAPLGLLAPALRDAGAQRIVAITHGHEAGWAALPGARSLLRKIGDSVDVMTYLGGYFRKRLARALSPAAVARMKQFSPSVDTNTFRPGAGGPAMRDRLGLAQRPIVLCVARLVARKGQDTLIRALPKVLASRDAVLVLVGHGRYAARLRSLARKLGVEANVAFAGEVPSEDLPAYYDAADVFAMPCRTRLGGLDVEGLGISALEAASTALPVIVGDSGGAPDSVIDGETGFVVQGTDPTAVAVRLNQLLSDPALAKAMGQKGRDWIERSWSSNSEGHHLKDLIEPEQRIAIR